MNNDGDVRDQVDGQPDPRSMDTQDLQRLAVDFPAIDLNAGFTLDGLRQHAGRDRTIELAGLARLGGKGQRQAVQAFGDRAHFLVEAGAQLHPGSSNPVGLLEGARRGQHGHPLRQEEIASVAVGDFLGVTGAAKFVHVLEE